MWVLFASAVDETISFISARTLKTPIDTWPGPGQGSDGTGIVPGVFYGSMGLQYGSCRSCLLGLQIIINTSSILVYFLNA